MSRHESTGYRSAARAEWRSAEDQSQSEVPSEPVVEEDLHYFPLLLQREALWVDVRILPGDIPVALGSASRVELHLDPIALVHRASMTLTYDPLVLRLTELAAEDGIVLLERQHDPSAGLLHLSFLVTDEAARESNSVARLQLEGLRAGISRLGLSSILVTDDSGQALRQLGRGASARVFVPTPTPSATPDVCLPIPDQSYSLIPPGSLTDRPPEVHPDLNIYIRGWEPVRHGRRLVEYDGGTDPRAPQLSGLLPGRFSPERPVSFERVFAVYDWDWARMRRGGLCSKYNVTLVGIAVRPGEIVHAPPSRRQIAPGLAALVLYATDRQIVLKYTLEDDVVAGYTIHVENVCVDPHLRELCDWCDQRGRRILPALGHGQAFGRARGREIRVSIRDNGDFMDPRSRKDWWQGFH